MYYNFFFFLALLINLAKSASCLVPFNLHRNEKKSLFFSVKPSEETVYDFWICSQEFDGWGN